MPKVGTQPLKTSKFAQQQCESLLFIDPLNQPYRKCRCVSREGVLNCSSNNTNRCLLTSSADLPEKDWATIRRAAIFSFPGPASVQGAHKVADSTFVMATEPGVGTDLPSCLLRIVIYAV